MSTTAPTTTTLRNGVEVLAKPRHAAGALLPATYANRTQATKRAEKEGTGWRVYQSPMSRVFFVARVSA